MITVDLKFYLDIAVQSAKAKSKYEGTVYSIYTEFKIYILLVQELAGKWTNDLDVANAMLVVFFSSLKPFTYYS